MSNHADDMHERPRRRSIDINSFVGNLVLGTIDRELARQAWRKHLAKRPKTGLGVEVAALLAEERHLRDIELDNRLSLYSH